MKKRCTVDIDGVLNYYPQCWLDFAAEKTGKVFQSKDEMKATLGEEKYKELKDAYRRSDFKANLPIREEGKELLKELEARGYEVIIVTTRPFKDYAHMNGMTKEWLVKNDIPHAELGEKNLDYLRSIENLEFHLDDELEGAKLAKSAGCQVFLFGDDEGDDIKKVERLIDILEHLD